MVPNNVVVALQMKTSLLTAINDIVQLLRIIVTDSIGTKQWEVWTTKQNGKGFTFFISGFTASHYKTHPQQKSLAC